MGAVVDKVTARIDNFKKAGAGCQLPDGNGVT